MTTIARVDQHRVADAVEVRLPLELAHHLGLKEGAALFAVPTAGGVLLTTEEGADKVAQLELGREFMEEYAETFRALAK